MSGNSLILVLLKNSNKEYLTYGKGKIKSEIITSFGGIYYASKAFYALSLDKVINGTLGVRSSTYNGYQWDEVMSAMSDVFLCGGDCVEDVNRFLLVFHKSCVIRIHQLVSYVKNQEVCLPLYRRMRQMDKDGKNVVAEFVYRHAV